MQAHRLEDTGIPIHCTSSLVRLSKSVPGAKPPPLPSGGGAKAEEQPKPKPRACQGDTCCLKIGQPAGGRAGGKPAAWDAIIADTIRPHQSLMQGILGQPEASEQCDLCRTASRGSPGPLLPNPTRTTAGTAPGRGADRITGRPNPRSPQPRPPSHRRNRRVACSSAPRVVYQRCTPDAEGMHKGCTTGSSVCIWCASGVHRWYTALGWPRPGSERGRCQGRALGAATRPVRRPSNGSGGGNGQDEPGEFSGRP